MEAGREGRSTLAGPDTLCPGRTVTTRGGGCGGMDQLQLANADAQKWVPKWMLDNGLGAIPFIMAALYEYLMLYGPGTFVASLICGWFLAATLIRVANSVKAKAKTETKSDDVA